MVVQAETVIQNSVSITNNGGVSTAKVKTIHNDKVIEDIDISTTTPYHYESNYKSEGVSSEILLNTTNKEEVDGVIQLTSLLNELRNLLAYYEKLLAQQSAQ